MRKRNFLMNKRSALLTGLIIIACTFYPPSTGLVFAEEIVDWNINMWCGPTVCNAPIKEFVNDMKKATNGRWRIKIHYNGVLAPAKECLDGIKAGLFEASGFRVSVAPGKTPLHRIHELPFITPFRTDHIQELVVALWEHPALKKELLQWNAVPFLPAGFCQYHLMGRKKVKKVTDFKGVRINVGRDIGKVLKKFGAIPTVIPAPKASDLIALPWWAFGDRKIHNISSYMIFISLGTIQCPFVANKNAYDALPEDFKKIHKQWYAKAAEKWAANYEQTNEKWLKIFNNHLHRIDFPNLERSQMVKRAENIYEEWIKEMENRGLPGKDVMDFFLKKRKALAGV